MFAALMEVWEITFLVTLQPFEGIERGRTPIERISTDLIDKVDAKRNLRPGACTNEENSLMIGEDQPNPRVSAFYFPPFG